MKKKKVANLDLCFDTEFNPQQLIRIPLDRSSPSKILEKEESLLARTSQVHGASRNPFLNFLKEFIRINVGLRGRNLFKMGGHVWRNMSDNQKLLYFELARHAPKKRRKKSWSKGWIRKKVRKIKRRWTRRSRQEDEDSGENSSS